MQQEQLKNKQIQQQHLMMAQKQATAAAANAAANANMQSSPRLQPSALQIQQQQHQHVTNANKRKLGQSESGQNGNQAYYNPRPEFNNPHQLQQLSVNTSMNPSQLPPTRPSTLSPDPTNGMTPPPPPQAQIDLIQESPPPQQSFASPPQPILQSMVADPSSTLHFEEIEKLLLATTQDMDVGDWLAEHQGDQAPVSANEVEKQVGDDIKDGGMSESDLFGVDPASEPDQGLTSTAFPSDQTLLTPNPSSPPDSPSLEIEPLTTLKGHVGKVTACAFDKESQVLASVGIDKQLIFWDLSSMSESSPEDGVKPMLNIERHSTKNISAIRFLKATHLYGESTEECVDSLSSGPALLATCGYDKVVQVTKLSSASSSSAMEAVSMTSFGGHQRSVTSVDFCPLAFSAPHKDWKVDYLVSSLDLEGDLFIWNAWTGDQLLSLKMV